MTFSISIFYHPYLDQCKLYCDVWFRSLHSYFFCFVVINMSSTVTENGDMLKITADKLSLQEVSEFVTDPSAGGISIFMGERKYMPYI